MTSRTRTVNSLLARVQDMKTTSEQIFYLAYHRIILSVCIQLSIFTLSYERAECSKLWCPVLDACLPVIDCGWEHKRIIFESPEVLMKTNQASKNVVIGSNEMLLVISLYVESLQSRLQDSSTGRFLSAKASIGFTVRCLFSKPMLHF